MSVQKFVIIVTKQTRTVSLIDPQPVKVLLAADPNRRKTIYEKKRELLAKCREPAKLQKQL